MIARKTIDSNFKFIVITALMFIIVGLIFLSVGVFVGVKNANVDDGRVYTTATIVRVESDFSRPGSTRHLTYTTYVVYEKDGETIEAKLNPSSSTDKIGDKVDVYYYLDNPTLVEEKGGNFAISIVFSLLGVAAVAAGGFFVYVAIKTKKDSKDSENNMATEFSAGYDSDID